ncbi:MAG: RagB/SusD family nutrient uptake outer membrane protein, partial [Bacteroidales bacterium]|nr:RagB/SusD family nutrient uptake outer membrane protein [Bacteroidales bacterium]
YTIVEHGTQHLGVIYDPHFDKAEVWSYRESKMVPNNDSRTYKITGTGNQYASYNGLVLRKHVDDDWLSPFEAENDKLILRYADVLEIYAEAKIELGQIDESVLDAMNMVRARAYKADYTDAAAYPKITTTDQGALRTILRAERRMEFAWENRRLYDIWRWRIAEKVLNFANYGLPAKNETKHRRYIDNNMWFFGATPQIDEDDCAHFADPVASGADGFFTSGNYAVKLTQRKFVAPKSYLWPIPTTTTNVMKNIRNNEGY